jgi:hypothetical protein
MSKHLSMGNKKDFFPLLIDRDGGFFCFYCKVTLSLPKFVFEHLNDDRRDNRIENIVFSCVSCNNKKQNDFDMQFKAKEKLKANEDNNFMREKSLPHYHNDKPSAEIDINMTNYDITEKFLTITIAKENTILYSDALDSCVYLCKKETQHGSQQSVRNYLNALTSRVGPFVISRNKDNKKIIVKRLEN